MVIADAATGTTNNEPAGRPVMVPHDRLRERLGPVGWYHVSAYDRQTSPKG
jgi:hypothetical protein